MDTTASRRVGNQKQLFVDDYFVAQKENVTLQVGEAEKHGVVIEPTLPTDFARGRAADTNNQIHRNPLTERYLLHCRQDFASAGAMARIAVSESWRIRGCTTCVSSLDGRITATYRRSLERR